MLRLFLKMPVLALSAAIALSCEAELPETSSTALQPPTKQSIYSKIGNQGSGAPEVLSYSANLQDLVLHAVNPSECGATEFNEVQWKHFTALAGDPVAMANFEHYRYLNRYAPFLPLGPQYFGKDGEYTKLVERLTKNLEMFWNMGDQVLVYGQHNETLNDREKLIEILWYLIEDVEEKEHLHSLVDELIYQNSLSPVLPESPFFASDGYASHNGKIVIGDGLVQLFTETGLQEEIVWTGILSHEWAHQVQYQHMAAWYPSGTFADQAERTRTLELEADFFSGYYMTHKRGATHNWKNAADFFELFYQAGDCSFEFEQHHGTPMQRKKASYEGYLLSDAAKKKGQILSAEELHQYFQLDVLPGIIQIL